MEIWSVLVFAAALAVAIATPGPSMVALVARVLAQGRARNLAFGVGLVIGDVVWLACAVFGIAALATWMHEVMVILKWAGVAYLIYLAYKLWTTPVAAGGRPAQSGRARHWGEIGSGLVMALANAKTMLFYLALLPNIIDVTGVDIGTFLQLSALLIVVYIGVLAVYMSGAHRARRLLTTPKALRAVNRGSAVVMTGAAAVVATRA